MIDHKTIEECFGKKYEELYPGVQKLLAENAEGEPKHQRLMEQLLAIYATLPSDGVVTIRDGGRKVNVAVKDIAPKSEDITRYFMHLGKGIQFTAEHYGEDLFITDISVVPPQDIKNHDAGLLTERRINDGTLIRADLKINLNPFFLTKAHRVAKTRNHVGGLGSGDNMPSSRQRLGKFLIDDKITLMGIEEADHAYWHKHPDKFEEKFKESLPIGKAITDAQYDDDRLESSATEMMRQGIKSLGISAWQVQ